MYFWSIEKLKDDLKKQTVTESELFKYLTVTVVAYLLGFLLPYANDIWYKLSVVLMSVITIFGLYYAYRCNGGKNGQNFLEKYISIGWVVSVRWAVFVMLPVMVVYLFIFEAIGYKILTIEGFFFDLVYISYFWMLGKHIKDTTR